MAVGSVFAVFIPALMLPGPDFVAVVRSAMTRGSRAGLATALGVSLGLGFYAALSLIGLSAILTQYQWLTWFVRILGGAYLVFLGLRLLIKRPDPVEIAGEAPRERSALLFGFVVTLTNPKAIVLFASVFATAASGAMPLWVMVLMIGLVIASSFAWYSAVSLVMASPPIMGRFRDTRHRIERLAGVCFVAIGLKIMSDARSPVAA
ncbi:LysE family translocator [Aurantimonas manganoxydans]|nr:LysE family translocator [Aurantimonas manganoxydans]